MNEQQTNVNHQQYLSYYAYQMIEEVLQWQIATWKNDQRCSCCLYTEYLIARANAVLAELKQLTSGN